MTDTWERLWQTFHEVREAPTDERSQTLDELCAGDAELRSQVEALLQADGKAHILDEPERMRLDLLEAAQVGEHFGRYTVTGKLGEGGMGSVYVARRHDGELEQEVALKVLRPDTATAASLERFEQERAILARLEHPGIARVLDAGRSADEVPFVALERVVGEPIDRYCRSRPLLERLEVFLQVCDAVSYAHRNLVVHRDLKPSNILVEDGGTAKLLDFGIARLIEVDTAPTETAARVLTPRYASPEQIRGEVVSTLSDVYSLGVVLYELLTQRSPYSGTEQSPLDLMRSIMEEEPERPSTARDPTESGQFDEAPGGRRIEVDRDLDAIVLRAMAKEPGRRYSSVDELGADLRRFRDGQPVEARADSRLYRAQKFVARNRVLVGLASATALAVLAAVIATSMLSLRPSRSLERERGERAAAEETSKLLVDLFTQADPGQADIGDVSASELLQSGGERLLATEGLAPAVKHRVVHAASEALIRLRALDKAEKLITEGLVPLDDDLTPLERARTQIMLAELELGRGESLAAIEPLEATLALTTRLDSEESRRLAFAARTRLARAHFAIGEVAKAEADLEQLLETADSYTEQFDTLRQLAELLRAKGDLDRSFALQQQVLELTSSDEGNRLHRAASRVELAETLLELDRVEEARELLDGSVDEMVAIFGPESSWQPLSNLGIALHHLGEFDEAERVFAQAIENARRNSEEATLATVLVNLGWLVHDLGSFEVAEDHYLESLDLNRDALGFDTPETIPALNNLGLARLDLGRHEEARVSFDEAIDLIARSYGEDSAPMGYLWTNLARLEHELGSVERAEDLYRRALELRRRVLPPGHSELGLTLTGLGGLLCELDRTAEGAHLVREAIAIREAKLARHDWRIALSENELGMCLWRAGQVDEARRLIQNSVDRVLAQRGGADPRARMAVARQAALAAGTPLPRTADGLSDVARPAAGR